METFAVDVGGVLANKQHEGEIMEGAASVLTGLRTKYNLVVVSQCGRNRALKTKEWMRENRLDTLFSEIIFIGFNEKNKNRVLGEIGASYLIDDRWKHIGPSLSLPKILRSFHLTDNPYPSGHSSYTPVKSWDEVMEYL